MKNKNANGRDAHESTDEAVEIEVSVHEIDRYPTVRRMMQALDRFLARRFLSVAGLYFFAIAACSVLLFSHGAANAFNGGNETDGMPGYAIWAYSIGATVSFIFILLMIRFIVVKRRAKKDNKTV